MSKSIVFQSGSSSDEAAWIALAVALLTLVLTSYWNWRAERRSFLDEFWFRQIIAPKCVDPIMDFHREWLIKIDAINTNSISVKFVKGILSDVQKDMTAVSDSAWIAGMFSSIYYGKCCESLDVVEDVFATELGKLVVSANNIEAAKSSMKKSIGDAAVKILSEAATMHGSKLKPR